MNWLKRGNSREPAEPEQTNNAALAPAHRKLRKARSINIKATTSDPNIAEEASSGPPPVGDISTRENTNGDTEPSRPRKGSLLAAEGTKSSDAKGHDVLTPPKLPEKDHPKADKSKRKAVPVEDTVIAQDKPKSNPESAPAPSTDEPSKTAAGSNPKRRTLRELLLLDTPTLPAEKKAAREAAANQPADQPTTAAPSAGKRRPSISSQNAAPANNATSAPLAVAAVAPAVPDKDERTRKPSSTRKSGNDASAPVSDTVPAVDQSNVNKNLGASSDPADKEKSKGGLLSFITWQGKPNPPTKAAEALKPAEKTRSRSSRDEPRSTSNTVPSEAVVASNGVKSDKKLQTSNEKGHSAKNDVLVRDFAPVGTLIVADGVPKTPVAEKELSRATESAPPPIEPAAPVPTEAEELDEDPRSGGRQKRGFFATLLAPNEPTHLNKEKRSNSRQRALSDAEEPIKDDLVPRHLSGADRRAHSSAVILQALIVGPSGNVAHTHPTTPAEVDKVKSQLLKPTTANKVIKQLRALPVVPGQDRPSLPIHAICLADTEEQAQRIHFAQLPKAEVVTKQRSLATPTVLSATTAQLAKLFDSTKLVNLVSNPGLGLGEPVTSDGILAGAIPSPGSLVRGFEQITPQLMAVGYATGQQIKPSHEGVYPPKDRMSVLTYWWGLEVVLPPPTLKYLETADSISHTVINFLTAISVTNGGIREILPFIRYIGQYIDFEFQSIKAQNRGAGVVCAATWLMPIALVPRPWDFADPPVKINTITTGSHTKSHSKHPSQSQKVIQPEVPAEAVKDNRHSHDRTREGRLSPEEERKESKSSKPRRPHPSKDDSTDDEISRSKPKRRSTLSRRYVAKPLPAGPPADN